MLAKRRQLRNYGVMNAVLTFVRRYPILTLAVAAIIAYLVLTLSGNNGIAVWVGIITVLIVIGVTAIDMLRDVLRGHYGLDILAVVAMVATLSVGEYLASLIIVLMLSGGEALEDYASYRASRELTALLDRSPRVAHRAIADDRTSFEDIPVEEVRVGDELLVRPHEIIPVNGTLLTDSASFDESSLTGESLPVTHRSGESLLSGILNGQSAIRIRATHLSVESEYQQILELVREAHESQAPIVRLADRFAIPFTVVSLLIAGIAWAVSGDPVRFAQVLVLATPCPLLIAAPVAFLGGLSRAARSGIVIKGGHVLETLATVRSVAFDKTGTLTEGRPELVDVRPAAGLSEEELLFLVASAEQYSSHVLAEGVLRAATERGIETVLSDEAEEEATQGVSAFINGRRVVVGKLSFVREHASEAQPTEIHDGQLAAYVSVDNTFAGAVVLADAVRSDAAELVSWLSAGGIERIAILSGDASTTVTEVGASLGITETHAELLPGDKVRLMRNFDPKPSLMVGDGVNDAPVLATADVGIAMGARGATAAGEAADAVILNDSLSRVAHAVSISKYTLRIALQAIWVGIVLSIGLMLVATTGVIPAVAGALIQEVIDIIAIVYALRTLSGKLPEFTGNTPLAVSRNASRAVSH